MPQYGGYGAVPYGGGPYGGHILEPGSADFDIFCFRHCLTMLNILTDVNVSVLPPGTHYTPNPTTCDLEIGSGGALPTTNALLTVVAGVPDKFTLEWTANFSDLPPDFNDLTNKHIFVGATDSAGPCAGLFVSKIGVAYAGGVHHTAGGDLVLDSTLQQIPDSHEYITTGAYITFRMAVSLDTGAVYLFITNTADIATTGHVLRAILPVIPFSALAFPPTDKTTVSVRGTAPQPSWMSLDQLCLSSAVLIPNLIPVADAGADQAVRMCSIVQLDGSASFDPEGAPLEYQWRLIDAPLDSIFAIELNDGATFVIDATGFTDRFHSPELELAHIADAIVFGDVLLLDGEARTIVSTGTDGNGWYLLFATQDIPDTLANAPFKVLRQRGISGDDEVKPTFYPDLPGFWSFDLVVDDGALSSDFSVVIVSVLESPLPRGCTPDLTFIFNYLSDFWNLVEDREPIAEYWGALAQVVASELYTLWQISYSKSLRDIQRYFVRRWLHYDPLLGEPIPELTSVRAIWAGLLSGAIPVAGTAGVAGTTLVLSSPILDTDISFTFPGSDPYTAEEISREVAATLERADSRITTTWFADHITTNDYFRIDAPFPLEVSSDSTFPTALLASGAENSHPQGSGAGVGSKTYKVDRSLQELDIQENDFLCLDGVAYRISRVLDDAGDDLPYQRVVVKEDLPVAPDTTWDIGATVTSEFLDFYNGLVAKDDPAYFEIVDTLGLDAPNFATNEIVSTTVLGVCEALPGSAAIAPLALGEYLAQSDEMATRLIRLVRRSYLPISDLVLDIPTLTRKIVIQTTADEQEVLHRNLDFFIGTLRGRNAISFVATLGGTDVWEGEDPPDRLWAEYSYLDNRPTIEANFGIPAEFTIDDVEELPEDVDYLSAVRGLWYAFFNGPTVRNLRIGTQILLGLPFAEEAGTIEEIRTDFSPTEGRILIRDAANAAIIRSYTFPSSLGMETNPDTGVDYAVGDTVSQFAPLVEGAEVTDYVKDPDWFLGMLNQGIFYEVEKFHRFMVRVDSAAFNLSALLFVRNFILKIKPTYTYPFFLVLKEIEETEISITDNMLLRGRLILSDTPCDGSIWLGSTTAFDDPRAAGGGWRSQFDGNADPDDADPTPHTPDSIIKWGFDKAYLCPHEVVQANICVLLAAPTTVTFDSGLKFDEPTDYKAAFLDTGPFIVPVGPAGLTITPDGSNVAPFNGVIDKVRTIFMGGPGTDPDDYEVVIAINAADETAIDVESVLPNTVHIESVGYAISASDVITARVRPDVGGPTSPAWTHVLIEAILQDATIWKFGETLPAGRYCSSGILGASSGDPDSIPDLEAMWLDDLGISGDPIQSWANATALGGSLVQATPAKRPTASTLGSRFSALFDDVDDQLDWDGAAGDMAFLHDGTGSTLIMVLYPTSGGYILDTGVKSSASNVGISLEYILGSERPRLRIANGSGTYLVEQVIGSLGDLPASTPALLTIRVGGTPDWEMRINGVVPTNGSGSFTGSPSSSDPTDGLTLGNRSDGTSPYGGKVAAVLFYDRDLITSEVGVVETWAYARGYGL
jgi:hypothetical protein